MTTLRQKSVFIHLADDLSFLEYGNEFQTRRAERPFLFQWNNVSLDMGRLAQHDVRLENNAVTVEFRQFHFLARFPGNTYCRPAPEFTPDFRVSITLALENEELVIRINRVENIGAHRVELLIAQGFFCFPSCEPGSLVLPMAYGARFDFPRTDHIDRHFTMGFGWTLPVHGRFTHEGGIGFFCDMPDSFYDFKVNTDYDYKTRVDCVQTFDDFATGPREMRFRLFPPGSDFRTLAHWCRNLRKASGRFKSIAEKKAERPEVGRIAGTVFWKHNIYYGIRPEGVEKTWSLYVARPDWNENEGLPNNWTAKEIFDTAKSAGFDRVYACNTGWNYAGYDSLYPKRLPPNPERGTAEEMKACSAYAKSLSEGYTLSVHDNYIDIYDSGEMIRDETRQSSPGAPILGGVWHGGQAYRLCSRFIMKYARRDLPRICELTGRGGIYLDVTAGSPLEQCRGNGHEHTRSEDLNLRRELFKYTQNLFGSLAVEGCGTDFFADVIDIGGYGMLHMLGFEPGTVHPVSIPLWQMVYHDSVFNYFGEGYAKVHGSEYRLYQALYGLLPTSFDAHSHRLSFGMRNAYESELADFEIIKPLSVDRMSDGSLETKGSARSFFSDGTEVIANFGKEDLRVDSLVIPPREYRILSPEKGLL